MVEITLPIMLQIVQTVALLIGIVYYITIMRNAQKTRRYEILQGFRAKRSQAEDMMKYAYVQNLEWEDYDDFQLRYGMKSNPKAWARIYSYLINFDDIGLMVRRGVIDIEDFYDISQRSVPSIWKKFQPIIEEDRKRGNPTSMADFEYLIKEMHSVSRRRGDNLLADLV
jgi:hypothetical protein